MTMDKKKAIELLGGSVASVADVVGVSYQAINKWPDQLPSRIADRVLAACLRKGIKVPAELLKKPAPQGAKHE